MRHALVTAIAGVTLSVSLLACASASVGESDPTPAAPPSPTLPPLSPPGPSLSTAPAVLQPSSTNPDAAAAVAAVQSEAAARVGTSPADVRVERVEPHEWGDSSLGCPQPGEMYSQIVTPGFLVVVTAGNQTLEYHSDARGRVVLCQRP